MDKIGAWIVVALFVAAVVIGVLLYQSHGDVLIIK